MVILNYDANAYEDNIGIVNNSMANSECLRSRVAVKMMLMYPDQSPVSRWFCETARVTPIAPGKVKPRLSGPAMRQSFYFAMYLKNTKLYVAEKKVDFISQLPTV